MPPTKKDPTVTSEATAESTGGAHPARPINEADDYAGDRKYVDMPEDMKPAPETVAQLEVLPEDEKGK